MTCDDVIQEGDTSLFIACEKGASAEVVKVLLDNGAEVNKANRVRVYIVCIHKVITVVCVYKLLLYMYIPTTDMYIYADVCFLSHALYYNTAQSYEAMCCLP